MESSLTIDKQLEERLNALAAARQMSPQAVMRDAVRDYVDRAERLAEFLYKAEQSKFEFDQTGRHLKSAAAFEWLDRWGGPDETEAPECQTLL
jgi:predicted transcriptional regulator